MSNTVSKSYDKYEGRLADMSTAIKTLQTQRVEMQTDWKGFKFYKE